MLIVWVLWYNYLSGQAHLKIETSGRFRSSIVKCFLGTKKLHAILNIIFKKNDGGKEILLELPLLVRKLEMEVGLGHSFQASSDNFAGAEERAAYAG